jgi:hypothetical protein
VGRFSSSVSRRLLAGIAVGLGFVVMCSACGGSESGDVFVLAATADGDGHLQGLPLQVGGGYPVGGEQRLAEALATERGYFPDLVTVSVGGDGGEFPDAPVAMMGEALQALGYDVLNVGKSEADACEELSASPLWFVSANFEHSMVDATYLAFDRGGSTFGVTGVISPELATGCESAMTQDPETALIELFDEEPQVDSWVVLAYMSVDAVDLGTDLLAGDHPVTAMVIGGARREADPLPWEPDTDRIGVLVDGGREWRDLLTLRLVVTGGRLVSYEGTRRMPLDFAHD